MQTQAQEARQGEQLRLAVGLDEAARALAVPRSTLYEEMGRGTLRSFKIGRRRVFSIAELNRYIADQEAQAASA